MIRIYFSPAGIADYADLGLIDNFTVCRLAK